MVVSHPSREATSLIQVFDVQVIWVPFLAVGDGQVPYEQHNFHNKLQDISAPLGGVPDLLSVSAH